MNPNQIEILVIEAFKSSGYLVINKKAIKKLGLIPAAILGNYIDKHLYFKKHTPENEGWFYLTHKQIANQLNIKEHSIVKNKQFLIDLGVIKTKKMGLPAKEWLKLNFNALLDLLTDNEEDMLQGQDPLFSGGQGPQFSGGLIYKENKEDKENKEEIDIKNNKLFSTSITVAPKKGATVIDKNKKYLPIVSKLENIIQTKKRIKVDGRKRSAWANSVRQLVELDGVDVVRVENALEWYKHHYMDDYVPVIESGRTLREKFIRLEAAIERSQSKRQRTRSGYSGSSKLTYKQSKTV